MLAAVVAIGVTLRSLIAARGWLYWDDLTLQAQAREFSVPSLELLFRDHDGHLMPGAWLVKWLLATLSPMNWSAAVLVLVLLQLLAGGAVARAAWLLCPRVTTLSVLGSRLTVPWAVVPLVLYMVSPLTLPATTWLAAAVTSLPLHAAMALTLAHSLQWVRPSVSGKSAGSRGHLLAAGSWLLFGCLFNERSLFLGPIVVLALLCFSFAAGAWTLEKRAVIQAAFVLAIPTLLWAVVYVIVIGDPRSSYQPTAGEQPLGTVDLFSHGYFLGLLPTAAGGPWQWERWHPGPPWADPGAAALIAGVVVIVLVGLFTARRGLRHLLVWFPTVVYPLAPLAALAFARTNPETAAEITQTLRHFSETAVLATLTLAVVLAHPARTTFRSRGVHRIATLSLVLVLFSALVSNVSYARIWAEQPAREYFHTLRAELADLGEAPILDQAVDLSVLLPVVYPYNQLSRLVGGLEAVPPVEDWTTDPVLIDGSGRVRDAELVALRSTGPGEEPGCGTRVSPTGSTLTLDGPLVDREWVVQLNYFADTEGSVILQLDDQPAEVPVNAGLNQIHVSLPGGGAALQVTPGQAVSELCVGDSRVGVLTVVD